jgi:hypothetical protein
LETAPTSAANARIRPRVRLEQARFGMPRDCDAFTRDAVGPIQEGWKPSRDESPIRAVRFANQPTDTVDTFATLGLSEFVLEMPRARRVRQELMLAACSRFSKEDLASCLTTLADFVKVGGRALLRGDVVGPHTPLIRGVRQPGCTAPCLWCSTAPSLRIRNRIRRPSWYGWFHSLTAKPSSLVERAGSGSRMSSNATVMSRLWDS